MDDNGWKGWQNIGNLLWLIIKVGAVLVVLYFAIIFWIMCMLASGAIPQ